MLLLIGYNFDPTYYLMVDITHPCSGRQVAKKELK